jgi:hypothetical protein
MCIMAAGCAGRGAARHALCPILLLSLLPRRPPPPRRCSWTPPPPGPRPRPAGAGDLPRTTPPPPRSGLVPSVGALTATATAMMMQANSTAMARVSSAKSSHPCWLAGWLAGGGGMARLTKKGEQPPQRQQHEEEERQRGGVSVAVAHGGAALLALEVRQEGLRHRRQRQVVALPVPARRRQPPHVPESQSPPPAQLSDRMIAQATEHIQSAQHAGSHRVTSMRLAFLAGSGRNRSGLVLARAGRPAGRGWGWSVLRARHRQRHPRTPPQR